jgi:hypothetical protein
MLAFCKSAAACGLYEIKRWKRHAQKTKILGEKG